jgi:hypothetical protein
MIELFHNENVREDDHVHVEEFHLGVDNYHAYSYTILL